MWPDRERHHQPAAAIGQLRDREQADQPGQPHIDRPGVDDERTAEQRADVAVAEIVQVRADVTDHPVLYLWAERVATPR